VGDFGVSARYAVVGTRGDYNGDGKSDLVLRDDNSVVLFQMNGTAIAWVGSHGASGSWSVVGTVGDYNGDGKSDLLLRKEVLADAGNLSLWQMNGTSIAAVGSASASANWNVVAGNADFNADGNSDVVLQNADSGALGLWLMNGMQVAQTYTENLGAEWTVFA